MVGEAFWTFGRWPRRGGGGSTSFTLFAQRLQVPALALLDLVSAIAPLAARRRRSVRRGEAILLGLHLTGWDGADRQSDKKNGDKQQLAIFVHESGSKWLQNFTRY